MRVATGAGLLGTGDTVGSKVSGAAFSASTGVTAGAETILAATSGMRVATSTGLLVAAGVGGSNVSGAAWSVGVTAGVATILGATSGIRVAAGAGLLGAAGMGGSNDCGAAASKRTGAGGEVAVILRATVTATISVRIGAALADTGDAVATDVGAGVGIAAGARVMAGAVLDIARAFDTGIAHAGDSSGGKAATGGASAAAPDAASGAVGAGGAVRAVGAVGGARYLVLAVSPSVFATIAAASASGSAISKVTSTAAFTGFLGGTGFGFAASSFAFIDAMARKSAEPAVAVKAPGYILANFLQNCIGVVFACKWTKAQSVPGSPVLGHLNLIYVRIPMAGKWFGRQNNWSSRNA